jgi:hypothetical protein
MESVCCRKKSIALYYAGVPEGKVNIVGGNRIGHSKQKKKMCICTCVLFRTVSEIELFHCTGARGSVVG